MSLKSSSTPIPQSVIEQEKEEIVLPLFGWRGKWKLCVRLWGFRNIILTEWDFCKWLLLLKVLSNIKAVPGLPRAFNFEERRSRKKEYFFLLQKQKRSLECIFKRKQVAQHQCNNAQSTGDSGDAPFCKFSSTTGEKCWAFESCKNPCLWRHVSSMASAILITSFAWNLAVGVICWHDCRGKVCKLGPGKLADGIAEPPCWILNNSSCIHTQVWFCST